MPRSFRTSALTAVVVAVLIAVLAGAVFALVVWRGLYDVSATGAHLQPVHSLLELAMHRSVKARAREIVVPPLSSGNMLARGAVCYRDSCVPCHGGAGVAPQPFAMSLQPLPGPLVDAARHWQPRELYWITRHGIKMSGMPAWALRLRDEDIWSVVAFLNQLPAMSPRDYEKHMETVATQTCRPADSCAGASCPSLSAQAVPVPGHDATRPQAPLLMRQYACTACHVIPGVVGSRSRVGPPLEGLWRRSLIAGKLPRTEEALIEWIRHPRRIDPETAMPELGVSEAHAREMAVYLLTPR